MTTDAELVLRAQQGEKDAFAQLVERFQPMVERVALRTVRHAGIAAELTQEAWLQTYLSLDGLRDEACFASWLYGIVLNVCRSYLRTRKIDFFSIDELAGGVYLEVNPFVATEPGPEETVELLELHQRVLHAVGALTPANREAVLLFYYDELSLRETAVILGISVNALKGRLHRARQQLQRYLQHDMNDEQEVNRMIPVSFANLIRVHINRVEETAPPWSVILLLDEAGKRVLPIWIGQGEAQALVGALLYARGESKLKRPMTWNFITRILEASAAELDSVTISALKEDVFYATVRLKMDDRVREIDARPSDAIPLALLLEKPLLVSEDAISPETWWPVPAGFAIQDSLLGVGTSGLELDPDTIHLEFEITFDEAEWEQLDEAAKEQYRNEHQQALRERVFTG